MCFNSKLVRLEVEELATTPLDVSMFQFQTGSIRSFTDDLCVIKWVCFNSKLVRLEGSPKSTLILYYTLTVPVKLIFILIRLEGSLLSTSNRANSLGG